MEEFTFEYIENYLMPRLLALRTELGSAGTLCELTMDEEEIPGILVLLEGLPAVYLTIMEGEDEVEEWYRFSVPISEDTADCARLLAPTDEFEDYAALLDAVRRFASGQLQRVYPLEEELRGEAEEKENEDDALLLDGNARLLPRTGALLSAIRGSYVEDCALQEEGVPCVIAVNDDFVCVMAYEEVDDNSYLLHFRSDIPISEGDDAKALCKSFNREHYFAQVRIGEQDLDLYGGDGDGQVYTFFASVPDNGGMKDASRYEMLLSLFDDEIAEFF